MLDDIRKSYGLTRSEVAQITGRSVNYLLKAEQATFPSAPIALLDFYARPHYDGPYRLTRAWQPYDIDLLRSDYRAFQRRKRRQWLTTWEPKDYTAGLPFQLKWSRRPNFDGAGLPAVGAFQFQDRVFVYPSAYAISVGLCIPAAVVYRNEKNLTKAGAIVTAMEDLVEYVASGEYQATEFGSDLLDEIYNIRRIAVEEGVDLNERSNSSSDSTAA